MIYNFPLTRDEYMAYRRRS